MGNGDPDGILLLTRIGFMVVWCLDKIEVPSMAVRLHQLVGWSVKAPKGTLLNGATQIMQDQRGMGFRRTCGLRRP